MHLCQHLQINRQMYTHALSAHNFANMRTQFSKHTDVHTHFDSQKAPHQYVPTTCEGTHTSINLPFFSLSFPLSSWEPSAGAFTSKPNIDQIPQTPPRHPPPSLPYSLSPPFYSPLPSLPLAASRPLSFWSVFEERGKRIAGLHEKKKRPDKEREWTVSREREEKMDKEKRCLGKEGNYDCKEGSSAMTDGRRVRNELLLCPSGSKMWTTMDRLLAYFSSSFITLFFSWRLWWCSPIALVSASTSF